MQIFTGCGNIPIGDIMYRQIADKLINWKNMPNRKPLIIKGARQIGKTFSILEFAKDNYNKVIEINFERDRKYVDLFDNAKTIKDVIQYIEIENMFMDFEKGPILLFLDEIQACPSALTALKFLSQETSFDIICSGSLLGIALANTSSFPVGYVQTLDMYPMNFIEFLLAMGMQEQHLTLLRNACSQNTPLSSSFHDQMNQLFDQYMVCGGMPACVETFANTKSHIEVLKIQKQIISDYIFDMAKYAPSEQKVKVHECFFSIPIQLAKENKKFQYKIIQRGAGARHFEGSLQWLMNSGTIIKTNRLSSIQAPLEGYVEWDIFKIYMADTGLLISQFDDSVIKQVLSGDLGIYKGALYENIVAQTLLNYGKKGYYYEPTNHSEIDFIIMYEGNITPIEVKGGIHTKSKSLHNFVIKNSSPIAYRLSKKNIGEIENSIHYIPLYLLPFLLEEENKLL